MLLFLQIITTAKAQPAGGLNGGNIPTYGRGRIRDFCIIARIDHDKSALVDHIIEKMGLLTEREIQDQVLDTMESKQGCGITVKSQATRAVYHAANDGEHIFDLIDTPRHVDFNYEVSRALATCDGTVLVAGVPQGIETQTLANVYMALDHDLEVIPVINEVDLSDTEPDRATTKIENVIGIEAESAPHISTKTGFSVDQALEAIMKQLPSPGGDEKAPLQVLILDSLYDNYRDVIIFPRMENGTARKGNHVRVTATDAEMGVVETGYFTPGHLTPCDGLSADMVGYLTTSIKNVWDTWVDDTVTYVENPTAEALPGYKKVTPMVCYDFYPADAAQYQDLHDAPEKLQLDDASLIHEPEILLTFGFGFRCDFFRLLHLEVIQKRLEYEYDLDLAATAFGVIYHACKMDGTILELMNPPSLLNVAEIEHMEKPVVSTEIVLTRKFIRPIVQLCQERHDLYLGTSYMEQDRVTLKYELPPNEIIYDLFDTLKSHSRGYASFDCELRGYRSLKLVKPDILTNRGTIDTLSPIVFVDGAYEKGRRAREELTKEIPHQLFDIPIQTVIGLKIIACEAVETMRKGVPAKCYDGDISREKRLLEKQKKGKKHMHQIGPVGIPQKAFMNVLKLGDE